MNLASSLFKRLNIESLLSFALCILTLQWIRGATLTTIWMTLAFFSFGSLFALYAGAFDRLVSVDRIDKLRKQGTGVILLFSFSALFLFYSLDLFSLPVSAQFFYNAEQKIKGYFNTGGLAGVAGNSTGNSSGSQNEAVVSLIFNILRFVFVGYLGYGLVRSIMAFFEQEDWKVVIKAPIIVFIVALIGDFLSSVILGSSTTAPTTP